MNENLNLVEILKDCPKFTKLYSPVYGDVELLSVQQKDGGEYPIEIKIDEISYDFFTIDGRLSAEHNGECVLFPSREQRDWSKFKQLKPELNVKKQKFDPKTLKPFDKVLVFFNGIWDCDLYSYIKTGSVDFCVCVSGSFDYCIPYNDDTKHLVGTHEEAPEFYRYWED